MKKPTVKAEQRRGVKQEGSSCKTEAKYERHQAKCERQVKAESSTAHVKAERQALPPLHAKVEQLRAVKAELRAVKQETNASAVKSLLERGLAIRREQGNKQSKTKGKVKVKKERSLRSDGRQRKKQKVTAKRRNASRRVMERELPLSQELSELLGSDALSRPEAVRRLWSYCKERGMLNPDNRREIRFDENLRKLIGQDSASMPQLISLLNPHFDYSHNGLKQEAKQELSGKQEEKVDIKRDLLKEEELQELKAELKEELKQELRLKEDLGESVLGAVRSKAETEDDTLFEEAAQQVVEQALSRSATEICSFSNTAMAVRCKVPPGTFALEAVAVPDLEGQDVLSSPCSVEYQEASDGTFTGFAEAKLEGLKPAVSYSVALRVVGGVGGARRSSLPAVLPQRSSPAQWSPREVRVWCGTQHCKELTRMAVDYEIDGSTLLALGEDDLKAAGIAAPFLLRRVLTSLAALSGAASAAAR